MSPNIAIFTKTNLKMLHFNSGIYIMQNTMVVVGLGVELSFGKNDQKGEKKNA